MQFFSLTLYTHSQFIAHLCMLRCTIENQKKLLCKELTKTRSLFSLFYIFLLFYCISISTHLTTHIKKEEGRRRNFHQHHHRRYTLGNPLLRCAADKKSLNSDVRVHAEFISTHQNFFSHSSIFTFFSSFFISSIIPGIEDISFTMCTYTSTTAPTSYSILSHSSCFFSV